nr:hypothetical protein [Tanacetum cinerariifolium]
MTLRTISSGLVQQSSHLTSYVPPSRNDWDLLFQPMFDELLNPPPSVVNQALEVIAPIPAVIPPVHADSIEAGATACFTQNRSIIRLRHGKTPYELLHRPALNEMTLRTISSGLVQQSSHLTSYVPPSRNDWDLLFQPMFDELLNPSPSVVNQAPKVIAPITEVIPPVHADSTGSPSLTTVDQDAPPSSKSHTTTEIQSSVIPQDVGDDNLDMEVAHMGNDPLIGVHIPEVTST